MQVPATSVICPIIVTKTYQQIQQTPGLMVPLTVSGSLSFCPGDWRHLGSPETQEALFLWRVAVVPQRTPVLHLAFTSHLLQRADYVLPSVAVVTPSLALWAALLVLVGPL